MKNIIGGLLGVLVLLTGHVQASINDLFISEYVQGSGYNKAIELFNGNGHTIDLSEYQLSFYLNGSTEQSFTIALSGHLSPYTTFVIANSLASPEIQIVADQSRNGIWFDGDDSVALIHHDQIIDSIGQVGLDASARWSQAQVGESFGTLRRLPSVDIGDVDLSDKVNFIDHWQSHGHNNYDGLGSFIMLGTSANVNNEEQDKSTDKTNACTSRDQALHYC